MPCGPPSLGFLIGFGAIVGAGAIIYSCGPAQICGIPLAIKNKVAALNANKKKKELIKQINENKGKDSLENEGLKAQLSHIESDIHEHNTIAKKHLVTMIPVVGTLTSFALN